MKANTSHINKYSTYKKNYSGKIKYTVSKTLNNHIKNIDI